MKKCISFVLCCLLTIGAVSSLISAQNRTTNDDAAIAKIKAKLTKHGTGASKRVKVKLLDGTQLNGNTNQIGDNSFDLTDSKTNQSKTIAFRDVAKLQVQNEGLSKGDKIAIGIVAGAAAVGAIVLGYYFYKINHN